MNCSLIICTYNWPEALSFVLASVTTQTELPNEIIVADDGSGESTSRVIEIFSKKNIRKKNIRTKTTGKNKPLKKTLENHKNHKNPLRKFV